MMNGMMYGSYGGYNNTINGLCNGGFLGFPFSALLFLGLLVLVLYLFRKNRKQLSKKEPAFKNDKSSTLDPAEVVRLRYARGDISFEEFQTILRNIQS